MRCMVGGAGHRLGPYPCTPSVGYAATSPVKDGGGQTCAYTVSSSPTDTIRLGGRLKYSTGVRPVRPRNR